MQYLLFGLRKPSITGKILAQFEGKFVALSLNKFGSHVVQKCLQELGEECHNRIIMELTCSPNVFLNVAQDNFGNFIIQTALAVSKVSQSINAPLHLLEYTYTYASLQASNYHMHHPIYNYLSLKHRLLTIYDYLYLLKAVVLKFTKN